MYRSKFFLLAVAGFAGVAIFTILYPRTPKQNDVAFYEGQSIAFNAVVSQEPDIRLDHQKVIVDVRDANVRGRVLLNMPLLPRLHYGDVIAFHCKLQQPATDIEGFNYARFLSAQKVFSLCWYPGVTTVGTEESFFRTLLGVKVRAVHVSQQLFPEPENSLLLGMLLGARQGTLPEWDEGLRKTGTSHIVVASGFNITILMTLIAKILSGRCGPRATLLVVVVFIFLFAILAGLEASIIRAGIMGGLTALARVIGRRASPLRLLVIACAVMLMIDPYLLVYDIGFQLSVAATLGLIVFTQPLERLFQKVPKTLGVRQSLVTTFAASFATLPISLSYFHTWSARSLLVNPLVLGLVPIAMGTGFIALVVGAISPALAKPFVLLAWLPLSLISDTILFFGK